MDPNIYQCHHRNITSMPPAYWAPVSFNVTTRGLTPILDTMGRATLLPHSAILLVQSPGLAPSAVIRHFFHITYTGIRLEHQQSIVSDWVPDTFMPYVMLRDPQHAFVSSGDHVLPPSGADACFVILDPSFTWWIRADLQNTVQEHDTHFLTSPIRVLLAWRRRQRRRRLAVAMATHGRLGSHTPLALLGAEPSLIRLIASQSIPFHPNQST